MSRIDQLVAGKQHSHVIKYICGHLLLFKCTLFF